MSKIDFIYFYKNAFEEGTAYIKWFFTGMRLGPYKSIEATESYLEYSDTSAND